MSERGYTISIEPHVEGRLEGKYDIHVYGRNGELILFSNQGYDNRADAVNTALKLFVPDTAISLHVLGADLGLDEVIKLR